MNKMTVSGVVKNEPTLNHVARGMEMYSFDMHVERASGVFDMIPCICNKIIAEKVKLGELNSFAGEIHSRNEEVEGKRVCKTFFIPYTEIETSEIGVNDVCLKGFICKQPIYRKTPLGREIADFLIAVNRRNGKSDYIHCIAWGQNAKEISECSVGDEIVVKGRFQSRKYNKTLPSGEVVEKIAYEVSANFIDKGCEIYE